MTAPPFCQCAGTCPECFDPCDRYGHEWIGAGSTDGYTDLVCRICGATTEKEHHHG